MTITTLLKAIYFAIMFDRQCSNKLAVNLNILRQVNRLIDTLLHSKVRKQADTSGSQDTQAGRQR